MLLVFSTRSLELRTTACTPNFFPLLTCKGPRYNPDLVFQFECDYDLNTVKCTDVTTTKFKKDVMRGASRDRVTTVNR